VRLAKFILRDMEGILQHWEAFAATQLPAAANMQSLALRDHAQEILEAVAADMVTPQTPDEQVQKSQGHGSSVDTSRTAAQAHALVRVQSGFEIMQLIAEYRALRASVLRLWADAGSPESTDLQDMVRFNEAIDQAITESVACYTEQRDQARDFFMAMLGHDMRGPLSTIQLTAKYLLKTNAAENVISAVSRIDRSGRRMQALLDDLFDFNRIRFGLGIAIAPAPADLGQEFAIEVEQLRAAHPGHVIELQVDGDVQGEWDANRLNQVLGNLVSNAVRYGDANAPVRVVLLGQPTEVILQVSNRGPRIEPPFLSQIFDPLKRGPETQSASGRDGNLGLGLYIAREIATAHGGTIEARSDENQTVFSVRLPRMR
jgi:signal transduction histidine kinase